MHGTDTSPLEVAASKKLGKPRVSMFGSCVLAEIPDPIRETSPNETRNIEGCFVHPGLVRGAVVQAKIRCDGGFEVVRFTARKSIIHVEDAVLCVVEIDCHIRRLGQLHAWEHARKTFPLYFDKHNPLTLRCNGQHEHLEWGLLPNSGRVDGGLRA